MRNTSQAAILAAATAIGSVPASAQSSLEFSPAFQLCMGQTQSDTNRCIETVAPAVNGDAANLGEIDFIFNSDEGAEQKKTITVPGKDGNPFTFTLEGSLE